MDNIFGCDVGDCLEHGDPVVPVLSGSEHIAPLPKGKISDGHVRISAWIRDWPRREDVLTPYVYVARLVRVYDGDTVFVDIDLGLQVWLHDQAIRLWGINAPEVRGVQQRQGLAARDWLRDRLNGVDLLIRTYKDRQGKYGRWLGELFEGDENINAALVAAGHATLVPGIALTSSCP